MAKFFRFPWATQGDKVATPDALQADGSCSYLQGFGFDYERPNSDAIYKPIPRDGMNGIFHDITEVIGELQRQGVPAYMPEAAPYLGSAIVRHAGSNWVSTADDNATVPGAPASKWVRFGAGVDVADIKTVATETPPYGWLSCDGTAVARAEYAALYEAIGTRYGTGDGSSTFNLPDLRGEFVRGWDSGRGIDADRALGSTQEAQNASHSHNANAAGAGSHTHSGSAGPAGGHYHHFSGQTDMQGHHTHVMRRALNIEVGIGHPHVTTANGEEGVTSESYGSGNHVHNFGGATDTQGVHSHGLAIEAIGDHSHGITVQPSGGGEARPRNIALLYVIKY